MARNNIYAPSASGGSTNWTAGISGALTDLGKSFRAQGDSGTLNVVMDTESCSHEVRNTSTAL